MKNITVICEGHTESNYISALNDYLWTVSQNLNIDHRNLKGINRNNYISEIKRSLNTLSVPNIFTYIFLDKDIFVRAGDNMSEIIAEIESVANQVITKTKKKANIIGEVKIIFNTMNGEDMMMLHESEEVAKQWHQLMQSKNHFKIPLHSDEYMAEIKNIDSSYKKNQKITLDNQKLQNFISNHNNQEIAMQSDIIDLINLVLNNCHTTA